MFKSMFGDLSGKLAKDATAAISAKVAKDAASEIGEKVAKDATAAIVGKVAKDAASEIGEKVAKDATSAIVGKVAKDAASEIGEKVAKDAASEIGEKVAKDAVSEIGEKVAKDAASEIGEKVAKDAAEKVGLQAGKKTIGKLGKYALIGVGISGLMALGVGIDVANKAEKTFKERDQKQFSITSIINGEGTVSTNDANVIVTFTNQDKIIMYIGEEIEISGTTVNSSDGKQVGNINGRFEIKKVIDLQTVLIVKVQNIGSNSGKGNFILHADKKNDVEKAINDNLNALDELIKDPLGSLIPDWLWTVLYVIIGVGVLGVLITLLIKFKTLVH